MANSVFSPKIERLTSAPIAVWVGAFTCYLSFMCAMILSRMMTSNVDSTPRNKLQDADESSMAGLSSSETDDASEMDPLLARTDESPSLANEGNWGDIFLLPKSFWIICSICVLLYGTVIPFNNIASDFLMSKWYPGDTIKAGAVMSYVFFLKSKTNQTLISLKI